MYALLRIARDQATGEEDYPAHRDILGILAGVGHGTAKAVADACITHNQNFRQLFYLSACPSWLTGRPVSAVQRVMSIVQVAGGWSMSDTLASRSGDIAGILSSQVFTTGGNAANNVGMWNTLAGALPGQTTLEELLQFLAADSEAEQEAILDMVNHRIDGSSPPSQTTVQKKIRVLTMHGAKGLSGKLVFIPSAEQRHYSKLQSTASNWSSYRAKAFVLRVSDSSNGLLHYFARGPAHRRPTHGVDSKTHCPPHALPVPK